MPVDPTYPIDRQQYILSNSGVNIVLMDLKYDIVQDEKSAFQFIDITDEKVNDYSDENLMIEKDSKELAYTIYTSGSTGRPKGVMIEHHSAVNLIEWVNNTFNVGTHDRLLFITSMCFDLSVYDIFGMLAAGGTVVIASQEEVRDVSILKQIIADERITFWDSVPTTLNYLIGELESEGTEYTQSTLRLAFMSGDWIPVNLPEKVNKYFPNANVISLGGATEGTVWSNYYPIERVEKEWLSIPYGKPIANNFFYILDDNLNPVPKGIVGELYIGGVGVAVGYANDKAKTDAAFVKDPFNKKLGGRMYRTGDLGRMDSNNNMEFIGRKDHQTKIRGFRVELGEIEHQLQKHELVKDAIVTVKKDTADSNFLCAYIVADEPVMANEYRQYLSDHLPEYMIPAHFISLESIPLTSNGKINRKALPDPEITIKHSTAYVAPENEIEEKLSLIWQRILRLEKLSVTDSIIEMGAHSLNIGSFVNTVRRDLNIEISIRDVFTNPTIRDLCQLIGGKEMAEEVIINPVPEADHFPTTHAQKRLWFLNQFDENLAAYNMPGAYMIEGEFDKVILEKAFRTLVERHESLRTKFDQVDGELVQVIDNSDDKKFALQYLDISQEEYKEELAKNYASGEASKLFDLTNGPLFRIKLIHLDDNKNLFLFTMHHIISDGWSKGVLLDEIMHLYNAFDNNQPNPLEPLAIQYKDYAVWQNEQLSKTALSEHRNYWLNQFEGTIPEIELPTDFDRPQVKSYKGDEVSMPIDGEILEFLNDFSKSNGGSLFMTLLTSVNALLHKFTGQEDIVVGSPVAGRDIDGLENQIGLYLNLSLIHI